MESLYKRKMKIGLADKEKRRDLSKQHSRAKKEELMDFKRRMPLGELNMVDPAKEEMDSKKAKQTDRLQQLREWQKARQAAKAKENAAKKPVFSHGKSQKSNFDLHIDTSGKPLTQESNTTIPKAKPSVTIAKQPVVSKQKTNGPVNQPKGKRVPAAPKSKNPPAAIEQNVTQPKRTRMVSNAQPVTKAKEVPRHKQPQRPQRPKSAQQSKSTQQSKSAQQPAKKDQSKDQKTNKNDAKTSKITRKVPPKQTSSSRVAPVRQSTRLASKPTIVSAQKLDVVVAPPSSSPPPPSPAPSQSSVPLVVEVSPVPPPSTPNKKTYTPICPSPLLHSRSATYRASSEPATIPSAIFVDEPAWVPGAFAPGGLDAEKFEKFKNSFSPFKFGNSDSNFQFSFKMDTKAEECSSDLSSTESMAMSKKASKESIRSDGNKTVDMSETTPVLSLDKLMIASPPLREETEDNNSTKKSPQKMSVKGQLISDSSKGRRRRSRMKLTYEEEDEEKKTQPSDGSVMTVSPVKSEEVKEMDKVERPGVNEVERVEKLCEEVTVTHSPSKGKRRRSQVVIKYDEESKVPKELLNKSSEASDELDIPRFRKIHSDVCEKLTSLSEEWEAKITALEESDGNLEEVLGQIRSTTGSARLLMKQKLKQYIGLVDAAETQSGHRKTTAEDLQGFWDMVYYQVDGLFKMFADLEDLEKNNWTAPQPSPKKLKIQRKSANKKPKKDAVTEASNERAQAARKKMMERRAELKRLKMRARQQVKEEEAVNEEQGGMAREVKKEAAKEEVTKDEVKNEEEKVEKPAKSSDQPCEAPVQKESCLDKVESKDLQNVNREPEDPVYPSPSPLRRSARIRNRSIFSPMCSPVLPVKRRKYAPQEESCQAQDVQEDVPTGMLIAF